MKYLSLFSGIGGFELGIEQAYAIRDADRSTKRGSKKDSARDKGKGLLPAKRKGANSAKRPIGTSNSDIFNERPSCVGYSEIDPYAIKIYQNHFPKHENFGDIEAIDETALPDFDLLCGGFPCQSFSIAGKRRGFVDTRGTLFFEICRILESKQPRFVFLENVKGLLSHEEGRTFITIITALDELGYDLEWKVLNSKDFGVPQNRERVFIIGHLRGTPRFKIFPFEETDQEDTRNVGEDLSYTIDANYHKGTNTLEKGRRQLIQLNQPRHSNNRIYSAKGISPTINTMQGGNRQPKILMYPQIRRLTPTECERLQGFPDGWTAGMSDTQRYKMLGNAVTVNVIQAIMEKWITA